MLWIKQFNVEICFSEQTQPYSYNKQQFYANWFITFSKHHSVLTSNCHLYVPLTRQWSIDVPDCKTQNLSHEIVNKWLFFVCFFLSAEHSFTLWDRWEVRGSKDFKLKDFLKSVQVSFCLQLTDCFVWTWLVNLASADYIAKRKDCNS